MRGRWLLAAALAAACTPAPQSAVAPPETAIAPASAPEPPPELSDADLHGRWLIVSLDGRPPVSGGGDRGERMPYLVFSGAYYGGSSGCNSFGGLGVLHGERYYASGAAMTAMGCGALTAQEDAIVGIMTASPRLSAGAGGDLIVSAGRGTMVLRRDAAAAPRSPEGGPETLAGSAWTIGGVDGRWLVPDELRTLRFEADRWSLSGGCGTRGGEWRQNGDRIEGRPDPIVTRACPAGAAALDDALAALLGSRPRFATGPNGELLVGGGGHWATGERPRAPLADEAPLLAGRWRIVLIDGRPPSPESDAQIAFGRDGFSGSAGCNSFQGHYLAHGRRLFTPPPIHTEMACRGALGAQERRVSALLAAAPRIALAPPDEIALVDAGGGLRLRRMAEAAPRFASGRLWTGAPLRAELTMLDGVPLQNHYSEPETRLRLSAQRFDIDSGCGRLGGIWRRPASPPGDPAFEFLTDPEPDPTGACAVALVRRLEALKRLLNGRARILIGPSGEIILAGEAHWLIGRVLPPARERR